jgi:BASS family bile acid:Na+ symporter
MNMLVAARRFIAAQLARLYGFDASHRLTLTLTLTLAIEIGLQNADPGVARAPAHFASETALPGALFAVRCILTAAGASSCLRPRGSAR